jgi:hypothetical protein
MGEMERGEHLAVFAKVEALTGKHRVLGRPVGTEAS